MKKLIIIVLFISISFQINAQWSRFYLPHTSANESVMALTSFGQNVIASLCDGISTSKYVCISTNNGANWTISSLQGQVTYCFCSDSNAVYAGSTSGIYKSTNGGFNWYQSGLNYGNTIYALYKYNNKIFAGAASTIPPNYYEYVYYSSDNGVQWIQTSLNIAIISFTSTGNTIFAGGVAQGIFKSTNNGLNWIYTGLNNNAFFDMATIGSNVYAAGAYNRFYFTTDLGLNWSFTSNTFNPSRLISRNNTLIGSGYGIYMSTNYGVNWIQKNEGMSQINTTVLLISGNYLYTGSDSFSVWRRPLNEVVGINNENSTIPDKFSLSQNYPNPFNPSTNIKYQIANNKFVSLKIFDILGKEIVTLVNDKQSAGTYEVKWDGSNYPSGVYFYRLMAGDFSETKKMVLIK
jgi:hypothetical protein